MTPFQAILAAKRAAETMEQAKYRVAVARAKQRVDDADIAELDAEVARQVAADEAAKASAAHEDQPMADDGEEAMEVDAEARFSPGPEGDDDNGAAAAPAAQAGVAAPRHSLLTGSYVEGSRVTSAAAAGAATHAAQAARGPRPAPGAAGAEGAFPMDDEAVWAHRVRAIALNRGMVLVKGSFRDQFQLSKHTGRPFAFAHPHDIDELGVRSGDLPVFYANAGSFRLSDNEFEIAVHMNLEFYWFAHRDPEWQGTGTPYNFGGGGGLPAVHIHESCRLRYREAMGNHEQAAELLGPTWGALGGGSHAVPIDTTGGGGSSLLMRGIAEVLRRQAGGETLMQKLQAQTDRLIRGGAATYSLVQSIASKFDEWADLSDNGDYHGCKQRAHTRIDGGGVPGLLMNAPGCAPQAALGPGLFFDLDDPVVVTDTRRDEVMAHARQFAVNVLGENDVTEMEESFARSSKHSVIGREAPAPRGRGCLVEIKVPTEEQKLRRCLALHKGLRKKFGGPMARVSTAAIEKYLRSEESGNWRALCGFEQDAEINVDHIHAKSWGGDDSLFNFVLVEAVVNRNWIGETGYRIARAYTALILDAGRVMLGAEEAMQQ